MKSIKHGAIQEWITISKSLGAYSMRCQKSVALSSPSPAPLGHRWCRGGSCSGADPGPFSVLLGDQTHTDESPLRAPPQSSWTTHSPSAAWEPRGQGSPDGICCLRRLPWLFSRPQPTQRQPALILGSDAVTRLASHGRPALASLILTHNHSLNNTCQFHSTITTLVIGVLTPWLMRCS